MKPKGQRSSRRAQPTRKTSPTSSITSPGREKCSTRRKGVLRNKILPFGLNAIIAKVYKGPSWLDNKECIVLDYSETSLLAHWIRDEIREVAPRTYLGKVYWSKKRLIDFALEFPAAG